MSKRLRNEQEGSPEHLEGFGLPKLGYGREPARPGGAGFPCPMRNPDKPYRTKPASRPNQALGPFIHSVLAFLRSTSGPAEAATSRMASNSDGVRTLRKVCPTLAHEVLREPSFRANRAGEPLGRYPDPVWTCADSLHTFWPIWGDAGQPSAKFGPFGPGQFRANDMVEFGRRGAKVGRCRAKIGRCQATVGRSKA